MQSLTKIAYTLSTSECQCLLGIVLDILSPCSRAEMCMQQLRYILYFLPLPITYLSIEPLLRQGGNPFSSKLKLSPWVNSVNFKFLTSLGVPPPQLYLPKMASGYRRSFHILHCCFLPSLVHSDWSCH